jgi:two-component system, NtrC family, C4-dicarboxylate transport response regulator DctD
MALAMQVKLLRVLEEREVQPIGADRPRSVDLRVVATSKRPLEEAVAAGTFRSDLFYRLNMMCLRVPPLRERRDDVALLFATFLEEAQERFGGEGFVLTEQVRQHLALHSWPGNVRELRNFAFRVAMDAGNDPASAPDQSLTERVRAFEASLIEDALLTAKGNVTAAIQALRLPRKTFYDKIDRLGIDLEAIRSSPRLSAPGKYNGRRSP